MADRILLLSLHLCERAVLTCRNEDRIITESFIPTRCSRNGACHFPMEDMLPAPINISQHRDETCRAMVDPFHFAQEFHHVRARVLLFSRITRRTYAWRSIEMIDKKTGIIGKYRHSGGSMHIPGFLQGVRFESITGLGQFLMDTHAVQIEQFPLLIEQGPDLFHLAGISGADDQ